MLHEMVWGPLAAKKKVKGGTRAVLGAGRAKKKCNASRRVPLAGSGGSPFAWPKAPSG